MKVLVLTFLALAAPAPAAAKGIASIGVVGAHGRSITIKPERALLAVMLYHPASVYNVRPKPARPHGGYVKLYPLGRGGFPAIPGRFYPATRALCFSWNQTLTPTRCGRLGVPANCDSSAQGLGCRDRGGATPTMAAVSRLGTT